MFLQIVTFPQITLQKSYEVLGYVKQGVLLVWARGTQATILVPLLRNNRIPSGTKMLFSSVEGGLCGPH